ncbi:MAG: sigma-70 family RNA polymerase sigma factor [Bacteroidaceae bacterium]|nr:sigma-70 family RNA polymerase sigma factor [Bacteroidaceae bacterium]
MTDKETIRALFLEHYDRMYLLARVLLHDDEESRDVVSEVFAGLLDGTIRVRPDTAGSFLLTCVRNRCLKVLRGKRVRERAQRLLAMGDEADVMPSLFGEIGKGLHTDSLEDVFRFCQEGLTEQTRRVFFMHYQERKRYADISAELHISEAAVYKHLAQALKRIKNHFISSEHGQE